MLPIPIKRLRANFPRATAAIEPHFDVLRKAITFALVGVVNALIDTAVFLLAYSYLKSDEATLRLLDALISRCGCIGLDTAELVLPNVLSWLVAVSCSYMMNSFITFAAESGRTLRWKAYGTFVASGLLGATANTITLVIAANFMPVLAAKGCAILAGFVVNFSMSHFVVFRHRAEAAERSR
jgi:putative flippase GtrA